MDQVKPAESSLDHDGCDAEGHAQHIWDWDIIWQYAKRPVRLRSCDGNGSVTSAWREALKKIGMPWGLAGELGEGVVELPAE